MDGVLTVSAEDDRFDDRLHVCRFGSEEVLLPERGVWFTRSEEPVGKMLRRAEDAPLFLESSVLYLPGPDDEDAPAGR